MKSTRLTVPKPPKGLSAEAASWWDKIVTGWDLDDAALLYLQMAMESLDELRKHEADVAKSGRSFKDVRGQTKINPQVLAARDARTMMLKYLKALPIDLEPLHPGAGRPPGS